MLRKFRRLFSAGPRDVSELPEALLSEAQSLQQQGQLDSAAVLLRSILSSHPNHWESLNALAAVTLESGDAEKAITLYDAVIELRPDRAESYYKRGNAANRLERPQLALADYDRVLVLDPCHARALCNRGAVLGALGRHEEALASYDRAIAADPADSLTHYNRGSVLKELKRFDEALSSYDKALELKPDFAEALVNRGNVLEELHRHEAAVESFDRAIELKPVHGEAFHGRAVALHLMNRFEQARADYDRAIALRPDFATFHANRGNLMLDWQRYDMAVPSYLKALELNPAELEAHCGLGQCFVALKQFEPAIASFDRAVELDASKDFLLGLRLATKMQACDWSTSTEELDSIAEGVGQQRAVCNPMTLSAVQDSPALHRTAAEIWVRESAPADDALGAIPARASSARIRVGYFSADFRMHPVSQLSAGLFERHDRSKFDVVAFAFGPQADDPMRARLGKAFDRFIDVRQRSDVEVATLAREMQIDIAVDLTGITAHCRAKIFALRAAPVQINYLGYPGTMGARYMDYLIADRIVVPPELRSHYSEKIVYLPDSFLPFDSSCFIADKTFTREELGLPPGAFVFCCFNNTNKFTTAIFDSWMRLLSRVDGSVLWLARTNAAAEKNLRREASRRGVDPRRLHFAAHLPSSAEHLARLRAADLFLDTFPYNAHATALDALWAGLPVLTCAGQGFASRVAASLLRCAGVPELITYSISQYEDAARDLAMNPERLLRLRAALAQNRPMTPLFDTERYTRNLETAYEKIYERHHSGAEPGDIDVRPANTAERGQ